VSRDNRTLHTLSHGQWQAQQHQARMAHHRWLTDLSNCGFLITESDMAFPPMCIAGPDAVELVGRLWLRANQ
jgi:hypothetical protein